MHSVFLADAHLRSPDDPGYRSLLAFLESLRGNTATLFILGDLFEFWIGYPEAAFPHYRPVLDALLSLKSSGTEIVYFEGNHDFHLGPFFEERLRATIHPGPAEIEIDGARIHLCHGDGVSPDLSYRLLRSVLHSRFTRLLIRIFPPAVALGAYRFLSKRSRGRCLSRRNHIAGSIHAYAGERFAEGCDAVVLGHFHLPMLENSGNGTLLAVGDWMEGRSYGELDDGVLTLRSWPEGESASAVIPKRAR